MPELTIVDVPTCASNLDWEKEVKGATGVYIVKFGRVEVGPAIRDYTCTCPHFQYRLSGTGVHCKHIIKVIVDELRCGWNESLEVGFDFPADKCCPKCHGPIIYERVGV